MQFRLHILLFVLVVAEGVAAAQLTGAKLNGIVIANEIGGPPMGNISLSAGDDASPTASDAVTGTFGFVFPKKRPGQAVRIYVGADGYVVVNDVQLQINLPDDPDQTSSKLTIILCKTTALERNEEQILP
jgi:hypothetical protein